MFYESGTLMIITVTHGERASPKLAYALPKPALSWAVDNEHGRYALYRHMRHITG
jgi:hypothetical protein